MICMDIVYAIIVMPTLSPDPVPLRTSSHRRSHQGRSDFHHIVRVKMVTHHGDGCQLSSKQLPSGDTSAQAVGRFMRSKHRRMAATISSSDTVITASTLSRTIGHVRSPDRPVPPHLSGPGTPRDLAKEQRESHSSSSMLAMHCMHRAKNKGIVWKKRCSVCALLSPFRQPGPADEAKLKAEFLPTAPQKPK